MSNVKFTKDRKLCLLSVIIIVGCYVVEKVISLTFVPNKTTSLVLAMAFTVCLGLVYLVLTKCQDYFYGMMVALLGYKMMPPSISGIDTVSLDAGMLYYVVKKVAIILFVLALIRLYRQQPDPKDIKTIPILALMFIVPFSSEIANTLAKYILTATGNMLYCYFAQFLLYVIAVTIIIEIAYKGNSTSRKFICYFEIVSLTINVLRKLCGVIVGLSSSIHVSKSNYVWIAIYLLFIGVFFVVSGKNIKDKELSETNA